MNVLLVYVPQPPRNKRLPFHVLQNIITVVSYKTEENNSSKARIDLKPLLKFMDSSETNVQNKFYPWFWFSSVHCKLLN